MSYYESNNDFLNFEGRISRKNYIINMLILSALYIGVSFIRFDVIEKFFTFQVFNTVLDFIVGLLKFAIIIAIMSVIYRRIADFSSLNDNMKKMFFILFLFPFLYLNWGNYLLNFIPPLTQLLDILTIFFLLPAAIISSVVFAFLKSKT